MVFLRPFSGDLSGIFKKEGTNMMKTNMMTTPDRTAELLALLGSSLSPGVLKDRLSGHKRPKDFGPFKVGQAFQGSKDFFQHDRPPFGGPVSSASGLRSGR